MAEEVWIQLYIGKETSGQAFCIEIAKNRINDLAKAVAEERKDDLGHIHYSKLLVYKAGTEDPSEEEGPLRFGAPVPSDTTEEKPLRVVAPAKLNQQELSSNMPETLKRLLTEVMEVKTLVNENKTESMYMSRMSLKYAEDLLSRQGITYETCRAARTLHELDDKEWTPFSWKKPEKEDMIEARQWLEKRLLEEEDKDKFGMIEARQWLEKRLLEEEDKDKFGIYDVTSYPLPEVESAGKKASGKGDLAIGDKGAMEYSLKNTDAPFPFARGLIELKTDENKFKVGQNLIQIVALSMASEFKTGVSLLATDCNEKWEVYYFLSYNKIQRIMEYKDAKQACKDFMQFIKTADDRKSEAEKATQLVGTVEEEQRREQDLDGFEIPAVDRKKAKLLEDEATLKRFAGYVGAIHGERPTIPTWVRAEARCVDYFS